MGFGHSQYHLPVDDFFGDDRYDSFRLKTKFQKVFDDYDRNNDGTISADVSQNF